MFLNFYKNIKHVFFIYGLSVCCRWPAERLGRSRPNLAGTHVDPGSVLVKVKVIWRHLVNAHKTTYRGPQGSRHLRPEDGYLQLVAYQLLVYYHPYRLSPTNFAAPN